VVQRLEALVKEIAEVANDRSSGDGIVAVVPVEDFWCVRNTMESAP
jgi:nitrogen regulatory protein PII